MSSLCHYCNNYTDTKNPCIKVKEKMMWCKNFILHDPLGRGNKKDIWPTTKWIYSYRNGFGNAIGYCSNCNIRTEKTKYCSNCGCKFMED